MNNQRTPRVAFDPARLTAAQYDGTACVVCGADYTTTPVPSVPVGMVDGGQVFACESCAVPSATVPGTWPDGEPDTVRQAATLRQAAETLRHAAARLDEQADALDDQAE